MTNPMTTQKTTAELIAWLEVQAEGFGPNDCGNICLAIKDRLAELEAALKAVEDYARKYEYHSNEEEDFMSAIEKMDKALQHKEPENA